MKKYIIILFLLFSFLGYSQESRPQNERVTSSQNAKFPGGDAAFTQEFLKMIHAYIDLKKCRKWTIRFLFLM